ncbi:MAG: pilus assembly protein [Caulobacter sp.]|nr:pilus assembly protein [Caulobacter sp.]
MKTDISVLGRVSRFLRGFRRDDGAVAVQFALVALPLAITVFGVFDVSRASNEKMHLQDALDAAALAAARSPATTDSQLQAIGASVLAADLSVSKAVLKSSSFKLEGSKVVATAQATISPYVAGLWLDGDMVLGAETEVTRSANNLEVALALDVTGSMSGSKISDLKDAAKELVDLVVQDVQTPYYTKLAIVPYSMGVNLGGYAQAARGSYSSGTCTSPGCQNYKFTNARGNLVTFPISTCVTERTGSQAYTDAAPGGAPVGRNYPSTNNPCPSATIMPLSTDRSALKSRIDDLQAAGSTAGQIGVGWGWYMVSPNFGSLWPAASRPAPYGTEKLLKVMVLMTDGDFNTTYCNGVISKDAGSGSGSSNDKINCNATNGDAFAQAKTLCTNMKAAGVIVYTVGFDVGGAQQAQNLLQSCATDAKHVYLPSSGAALKDAFRAIGQDISQLRLSR